MWNLKYTNKNLFYNSETDSWTQRSDSWLPKGRGEEGRTGTVGLSDVNYFIYRIDKQ